MTVAAWEGRRERRTRETRRRILDSALELFAERGVELVTIEEIAERADVARGTVFNHFGTKELLLRGLGQLQLEALHEALAEGRLPETSTRERILAAMRLLARFPGLSAESCRQILVRCMASLQPGEVPAHRQELARLFEGWVAEGQARGEFRTDLPASELAGFILGLQFQATLRWACGYVESLEEYLEQVLRIGVEGMRAE